MGTSSAGALNTRGGGNLQHLSEIVVYLGNGTMLAYGYYVSHIGSHIYFFYSNFYSAMHTVVTSEALGTCERLAQGRYSAMRRRPGVEPATC